MRPIPNEPDFQMHNSAQMPEPYRRRLKSWSGLSVCHAGTPPGAYLA
jgi:hypothetical protein